MEKSRDGKHQRAFAFLVHGLFTETVTLSCHPKWSEHIMSQATTYNPAVILHLSLCITLPGPGAGRVPKDVLLEGENVPDVPCMRGMEEPF